jgi:cyclophilin family peptidyl-prolyl cis-trans isomerase/HEAT repeat protein
VRICIVLLGVLGVTGLTTVAGADDLETAVATAELGRRYDDDLLRKAAESPRAATRRAAARAAGRLKDERAVAWLLPLLRDSKGPVRRSALFALGQINSPNVSIHLRSQLRDLESTDLPHALEALGKSGDPRAVSEVVSYLGHRDAPVRGAAALALSRLGDTSAVPDLFAALVLEEDDRTVTVAGHLRTIVAARDPEARWRIIYAAWFLLRAQQRARGKPVEGEENWVRLLRASAEPDRPRHERVFALRALGTLAGQQAWLLARLDEADPEAAVAILRGTARPWDAETAERVARFVKVEDPLLRETALGHLMAGQEKAADLLRRTANDLADVPRLQIRALEAAVTAGAKGIEMPTEPGDTALADFEEAVWRVNSHFPDRLPAALPKTRRGQIAAADVCGEERVPRAVALKTLLALLKVPDYTVRTTALGSLARRGGSEHAAEIVAAAKASPGTRDSDVRLAAAGALAKLKHYDPWLTVAASEDPDRPVREAAREALKALDKPVPAAVPLPGFRLHDHDAAGILAAARALVGARVTLKTNRGEIEMVLLPDEAPAHCVNFATLVQQGFYDGLTWHRVVPNFVIQGGCPRGDGWGGPGYTLPDEIATQAGRRYVRGTVGMPKAGDDTGGCQIFITHLPTPHLDGRYSIYAQVVSGLAVVDRIRIGDRIEKATIRLSGDK